MMYTEYYYPEATEERLSNDRRYTRKLPSLLTSVNWEVP
jgi:hypothetical protein